MPPALIGPHRVLEPGVKEIGLAWLHDLSGPVRSIWHNGGAMGMSSWAGVRPATAQRVVTLMNAGWRRTQRLDVLAKACLRDDATRRDCPGAQTGK